MIIECIEFIIDCVNIWKKSEAAKEQSLYWNEQNIALVYANFGVEDLRHEIGVFKGAEPKYSISFVSSHQLYELRHMRVLVKILTVDQFSNIEKNESSTNKFLLKVSGKRFTFKILFNRIKLKQKQKEHAYINWNNPDVSKILILVVEIEKLH